MKILKPITFVARTMPDDSAEFAEKARVLWAYHGERPLGIITESDFSTLLVETFSMPRDAANFRGLVLGCIEANFCKEICV